MEGKSYFQYFHSIHYNKYTWISVLFRGLIKSNTLRGFKFYLRQCEKKILNFRLDFIVLYRWWKRVIMPKDTRSKYEHFLIGSCTNVLRDDFVERYSRGDKIDLSTSKPFSGPMMLPTKGECLKLWWSGVTTESLCYTEPSLGW